MRTVIAPLDAEVEAQLARMDAKRADVARRYIARLRLEPLLGHPLTRGVLASAGARAVYFDRDSVPADLFGSRRPPRRAGGQDASHGPGWRVVYVLLESVRTGVRVVAVLGVGRGHTPVGEDDVYDAAERLLLRRYERRTS